MPRQIVVKASFNKSYHLLPSSDQRLVDAALGLFERYLETNQASPGLGIKRLGSHTYEFRIGLAIRAVYVMDGAKIFLSLLGTHDEVRKFLKRQ